MIRASAAAASSIAPCNWLQHFENVVDPYHVPILHGSFSGAQFVEQMSAFPKVKFEYGPMGVKATSIRPGPGGKRFRRVTEAVLPTLRVVANPQVAQYGMVESIGWTLPIDDTHYRIYVAGRVKEKGELTKFKSTLQRQDLGRAHAGGTPEIPGRCRGAGRPGADHLPFGGASDDLRSGHRHAASDCSSASSRRWPPARIRSAWRSPSRTPM